MKCVKYFFCSGNNLPILPLDICEYIDELVTPSWTKCSICNCQIVHIKKNGTITNIRYNYSIVNGKSICYCCKHKQ